MKPKYYIPLSVGWSWLVTDQTWRFMEQGSKAIIAANSPAPYQYRLLIPYALNPLGEAVSWSAAVFVFWWLVLVAFVPLMWLIGRELGSDKSHDTAVALFVGLIPVLIMFHPALAHTNGLEAVFMAAALLVILKGKVWPLYPLVFVATFNRETALLIPLMYIFAGRGKIYLHSTALVFVWTAVFIGLRLWLGAVPNHVTLAEIWAINTGAGLFRFLLGLLILSPLFLLAWRGWKVAPEGLRRAAVAVPVYLGFVLVFGVWHEWRLLLTVYPLLIPLAGFGIRGRIYTRTVTAAFPDYPAGVPEIKHYKFTNDAGYSFEVLPEKEEKDD